MMSFLKPILFAVSISYPFLVYFGLQHFSATILIVFILSLLALRLFSSHDNRERYVLLLTLVGIVVLSLSVSHTLSLKFYPVLMNLSFFILFFTSLYSKRPIIERMVRLKDNDLSAEAMSYMRNLTKVWCLFFIANGMIAAITALYTSPEIWLLYNGFISYLLIASLLVGEWLFRQYLLRQKSL